MQNANDKPTTPSIQHNDKINPIVTSSKCKTNPPKLRQTSGSSPSDSIESPLEAEGEGISVDLAWQLNLVMDRDYVQEVLDSHNQELAIDEFIETQEQELGIEELETLDPIQPD
ncbi:hypothetical protein TNCV_3670071 [Trichonephila clavipes]|nr:hypothetical protein TNCV_3670071 [Trichonephila clavipes]